MPRAPHARPRSPRSPAPASSNASPPILQIDPAIVLASQSYANNVIATHEMRDNPHPQYCARRPAYDYYRGPLANMESFGLRDLKGKGATDMWLAGVPIERIQLLCGHASKQTTEKYIKARWRETAKPNQLEVKATKR